MTRLILSVISLLLISTLVMGQPGFACAAAANWPLANDWQSPLVFVHPLVNYAINPVWQRDWERQLLQTNGIQISSGSVSTSDLCTDLTVNITEPLGQRFRFLYRAVWRDGLHLDTDRQQHWLGFELELLSGAAIYLQVHPAADKEEFDLLAGLSFTDESRERYLRLGLQLEDFLYERKNDRGGISVEEPVGIVWELRCQSGSWEAFSTGQYGSGSQRIYPNSTLSPTLAGASQRNTGSILRLRYVWTDLGFAGVEGSHYRFDATEQKRHAADSFDYTNEYVHLRGLAVFALNNSWGLRPEFHWLWQTATAEGRDNIFHHREDVFPALFIELHSSGKSSWELGYLASSRQWDFETGNQTTNGSDYTDKIKLGWSYAFQPTARVQFSLSHELDLHRFGGGNVQYQMDF